MAVAPCPLGHDFHGQGAAVTDGLDMAHEAAQGTIRTPKGEPQTASLDQILLDTRLQ
jgi:hypothetical protein